ncbi:WD40 repeat domain-containing protein [Streptomyces sp. DSM 3412]|uniref:WD40 repeat domain-containing protein n=1 Tax=Streptomyces gottesmaniae TaxID=3075518 RepID=A0ABU2YNZ3_9ACTN|nr:WD40 repeat domain-containing protein [Streptomyces sp. DSM 3412]MDT0566052.1 WD40 repeat domain-containing protein [Streptomyces sp. DSM 3412]
MAASEREFLDADLAAQAAERAGVLRRTRSRPLGVGAPGMLLVLATTTVALAVRARRTADQQRDTVGSQRATDRAAALRAVDPAPAAQLGLAAYRLASTPEARGSVLSTFATPYATWLTGPPGAVTAVAFSADGRVRATGDTERTVRLHQVPDAHRPAAPVTMGRRARTGPPSCGTPASTASPSASASRPPRPSPGPDGGSTSPVGVPSALRGLSPPNARGSPWWSQGAGRRVRGGVRGGCSSGCARWTSCSSSTGCRGRTRS